MAAHPLKIPIQNHKTDALCANDCNPSLNLNRICNGTCFQICPLLCKTLTFQIPPIPPLPPVIIRRPAAETGNLPQPNTIAVVMIIIAVFLGAAIIVCFFICFLSFYIRQRRETRERAQDQDRDRPVFFGTSEDFLDEDQRPGLDHHVWYINTVGLQRSVIDLIAVFKYRKDDFFIEGAECSVCLNEFIDDESLKVLPKCTHAFHVHCIDTWLTSHKNCPLCRAPIVSDDFDIQVGSNSSFNSASHGSTSLREGEEGSSETLNEDESGLLVLDIGETTWSNSESKLSGPRDTKEVWGLTRCMSLDSSLAIANVVGGQSRRQFRVSQLEGLRGKNVSRRVSCGSGSFRRMVKSSSIGHMLQKGHVSMKRSFWSTSKSSSLRYIRSRDSILPL